MCRVDDPSRDPKIIGEPQHTLFLGRLGYETTEETLKSIFSRHGPLLNVTVVRDIGMWTGCCCSWWGGFSERCQ